MPRRDPAGSCPCGWTRGLNCNATAKSSALPRRDPAGSCPCGWTRGVNGNATAKSSAMPRHGPAGSCPCGWTRGSSWSVAIFDGFGQPLNGDAHMNNVCVFSLGRHTLKPMHAPHGMPLARTAAPKQHVRDAPAQAWTVQQVPGISLETLHCTASRRWFVADPAAKQGKSSRARSRGDGFSLQPIGRQRVRTASAMARTSLDPATKQGKPSLAWRRGDGSWLTLHRSKGNPPLHGVAAMARG